MQPFKRRKLLSDSHKGDGATHGASSSGDTVDLLSLDAPISPPACRTSVASPAPGRIATREPDTAPETPQTRTARECRLAPSPVQLIRIAELSPAENVDTLGIKDILGDPLIKECWAFNYCFDVEWLLSNFDEDVRHQIRVVLVHGAWKRESLTRVHIEQAVKRYPNVRAITAYMPDPFGTHHTKMFILIRHDDLAQIVIFTANLLSQDWRMCQAVWRSPLLPLLSDPIHQASAPPFGTGARFQFDLRAYLDAYGGRLQELSQIIRHYDFTAVKACLIASTPGRQDPNEADIDRKTLWGWPALQASVQRIPNLNSSTGHFVAQVSSIATLGVTPAWLHETLCKAMQGSHRARANPKLSIVFPTAAEIRRTVDGYSCGGSVHMKLQTAANQKQLKYLKPHLCHWAGDGDRSSDYERVREAGRGRTGPHIKTYLRFADAEMTRLDWAMITSANLSKQAWGTEGGAKGEVRISSFEIGVLFWPDLWKTEETPDVRMVPVFKTDMPERGARGAAEQADRLVGWRMPYDLPLVHYEAHEQPWCATQPHLEPDWRGGVWRG